MSFTLGPPPDPKDDRFFQWLALLWKWVRGGLGLLANLGTTSTVLHGNASGNPAFSAVLLPEINLPVSGTPADTTTALDWFRHSWSTGMTDPDTALGITLNGAAGTVDVAANDFVTRQGTLQDSPIAVYRDAGTSGLALTANDVSYVFRNYNGGAPVWQMGNLLSDFNGIDKVISYAVARNGTRMNVISAQGINVDFNRKMRRRSVEWNNYLFNGFYQSALGPSSVTASGLKILVTAGKYFWFDNPHTHAAFDTTVAGAADANNFIYFYNRTPPWTQVTGQKSIDATQYDNAGTLTTMTNNRWRTDWLYVALDDAGAPYIAVVYGNAQYLNQTAAFADPQPVVPHQLDGIAVLLGQITLQKSDATFTFRQANGITFTGTASSVATALADATGQVDVSAATAPTVNQHLEATDATHAVWTSAITGTTGSYTGLITVNLNATALPTPLPGAVLQMANLDATALRVDVVGYGSGGAVGFSGRHSGGTAASPSASVAAQSAFALNAFGYDNTNLWSSAASAQFVAIYGETWSSTGHGILWRAITTPNGSLIAATAFDILGDGTVKGYGTTDATSTTTGNTFAGGISSQKAIVAGTTVKTGGYTVGTLPAGSVGMRAYVTDALAPAFGATLVGGGAVNEPAYYNGTNWIAA